MRWSEAPLALAVLAAAAVPAGAGAAPPRAFVVTVSGSGSYHADYGQERKEPGRTRGVGLDGLESGTFTWQIRVVAYGRLLEPKAAIGRMSFTYASDVVEWSMNGGELKEDPACRIDGRPAPRGLVGTQRMTWAGKAGVFDPNGDWVRDSSIRISKEPRGLFVDQPFERDLIRGCHLGFHRVKFLGGADSTDVRIPRSEWNPRGRGRFHQVYRDEVTKTPDHEAEPNSFHTFTARSQLVIDIKGLSARAARKRASDYRRHPANEQLPAGQSG